ncbi:MAG: phosphatase PAP2 family protein [Ilumatobacteraceae bacterium]
MVSPASDRELAARPPEPSLVERTFPRGVGPTAVELLVGYVVLTGLWVGMGLLLTGPFGSSALIDFDQDVARWFVDQRTPTLDGWANAGATLADTLVKVIATAVIAVIMFALWHSLREPLVVALALVLEASAFITVTWIVGRDRPVDRLEESPVGSSFPSGHVAAAAAYAAVAVVIFERTRNVWIRGVTVVVVVAVPVIVGIARMYQGMHFFTDVVAGVVLGAASVVVVYVIFRPGRDQQIAASTPR